jgi:hypothetical protein
VRAFAHLALAGLNGRHNIDEAPDISAAAPMTSCRGGDSRSARVRLEVGVGNESATDDDVERGVGATEASVLQFRSV